MMVPSSDALPELEAWTPEDAKVTVAPKYIYVYTYIHIYVYAG